MFVINRSIDKHKRNNISNKQIIWFRKPDWVEDVSQFKISFGFVYKTEF